MEYQPKRYCAKNIKSSHSASLTSWVDHAWSGQRCLYKIVETTCRRLRTRIWVITLFNDVPLWTTRALSSLTLYSDKALLVLNGPLLNSDSSFLALKWQCMPRYTLHYIKPLHVPPFCLGSSLQYKYVVMTLYPGTIKARSVFGTLSSAISNFQTSFVRTVMEVLKYCWM